VVEHTVSPAVEVWKFTLLGDPSPLLGKEVKSHAVIFVRRFAGRTHRIPLYGLNLLHLAWTSQPIGQIHNALMARVKFDSELRLLWRRAVSAPSVPERSLNTTGGMATALEMVTPLAPKTLYGVPLVNASRAVLDPRLQHGGPKFWMGRLLFSHGPGEQHG